MREGLEGANAREAQSLRRSLREFEVGCELDGLRESLEEAGAPRAKRQALGKESDEVRGGPEDAEELPAEPAREQEGRGPRGSVFA